MSFDAFWFLIFDARNLILVFDWSMGRSEMQQAMLEVWGTAAPQVILSRKKDPLHNVRFSQPIIEPTMCFGIAP